MSNISKRRREGSRSKIKSMGDHKEFLKRITKTLYYGQLPSLPCLSLPVTEISCGLWSEAQRGRSLRRLHADAAAHIARSACVSPCALVLAILYLERLHACNPSYLAAAEPADLFLVSLMVGNKFLQDDGEDDEVICSEWASSGGIELKQLNKLEAEFLNAINWNVYVSEESFEAGLVWLEKQVALKQAQLRGFFTYSDLAAAGGAARAGAALALGYVAALAAVLASALALTATLPYSTARPASLQMNVTTPATVDNSTITVHAPNVLNDQVIDQLKCCSEWTKYQDQVTPKKKWADNIVINDWKSFEPWWSRTSVLNWLYHSSLISPMNRWLDKVNEYGDILTRGLNDLYSKHEEFYEDAVRSTSPQYCVRQWLNLSKLSALVVTVSDR